MALDQRFQDKNYILSCGWGKILHHLRKQFDLWATERLANKGYKGFKGHKGKTLFVPSFVSFVSFVSLVFNERVIVDSMLHVRRAILCALVACGVGAVQVAADSTAPELALALQRKYEGIKDFSADFTHAYEGGVLHKQIAELPFTNFVLPNASITASLLNGFTNSSRKLIPQ